MGDTWLDPLIHRALRESGLPYAARGDWRPRSPRLQEALAAMGARQFERAMPQLAAAQRAGDAAAELTVVGRVLVMGVDAQLDRLAAAIARERQLHDTAGGQIHLLELRIQRLEYRPSRRMDWIAAAAAALIITTTLLAALRFGLPPIAAVAPLATFAAGAALLLTVDRRRQRRAFHERRAAIRAEIAEETQILQADRRQREARIGELEGERDALCTLRARAGAAGR